MVDINEELERMNKIINDLLTLVKMDKMHRKSIFPRSILMNFSKQF